MPMEFQRNIEKYKENNVVVFEGIDFFVIWFLLVTKNYNYLASKYVDMGGRFQSREEVIAFLKKRVSKIAVSRTSPTANVIFNGIQ